MAKLDDISKNCLFVDNNKVFFSLYSKSIINPMVDYDYDDMENHILGVIRIRDNMNSDVESMSIDSVYAVKGYGYLMYLIAMHFANDYHGITLSSTHEKSYLTKAAAGVWKEFFDGKGSDYATYSDIGLDVHDDDYLNYGYSIDVNIDRNIKKSIDNHIDLISPDPYGDKSTMIHETADSVLSSEMSAIYESIGKLPTFAEFLRFNK